MRAILAQALMEASNAVGDHATALRKRGIAEGVTEGDRVLYTALTARMMALARELADWCERAEGYPDPPWPTKADARARGKE